MQIIQLQNQMKTVEKNVRNKVNKDFEQIRARDKQEIQQLKSILEDMHRNIQASQGRATQQDELVRKLQAKVSSTENMIVDITVFQAQDLEVRKELEATQQSLLTKVKTVQDHFRVIDQELNNIFLREREVISAWTTFQEGVVLGTKYQYSIEKPQNKYSTP
jgi:seryl-tRNA synthetase